MADAVDSLPLSQSSDLNEEQLKQLETMARPESTKRATDYGVKKFTDWLKKRSRNCDFSSVTAEELNELLRKYYAEVKPCKQGSSLSASTLTGLRASIHRHVSGAPFNRPFNIIKDKEFMSSNKMFTARCKLYFKTGNPRPKHKPPIGDGDMKKLGQYFSRWESCPGILIESVWFLLCYHFGRRGREGWANMTRNTFGIDQDSESHEYVYPRETEVTKNHQGGHKQSDVDYADQRMYGPGVQIFRFYLSKLHPKNQRLFQTPVTAQKFDPASPWYKNEPMGKNTLSSMMPRISTKAGLSRSYTCHSVWASTVTILYQAGVQTQSIIAVTKHKNTASLGHYIQDISVQQKRDVSSILSSALGAPLPDTSSKENVKTPSLEVEPYTFSDTEDHDNTVEFDLNFDWIDESKIVKSDNKDNATHTSLMPVIDVPIGQDGVIDVPSNPIPGTVYNVSVPVPQTHQQIPLNPSIMSNATFNGCTINFQLKQM